ncbi:uncharacterized protein LOC118424688 isoform X1 [Branchiostoma floridae]|uniref:Uncharacterized protein LOC118424688 isoform X1 n=1 Tax=Branchiostoma floridae TaxID=7739 RepID=A0A9J7LV76_BRAFL|nr:uncharacterized protein LOC118424688 isoform X1 [Branchiostoma floridae]
MLANTLRQSLCRCRPAAYAQVLRPLSTAANGGGRGTVDVGKDADVAQPLSHAPKDSTSPPGWKAAAVQSLFTDGVMSDRAAMEATVKETKPAEVVTGDAAASMAIPEVPASDVLSSEAVIEEAVVAEVVAQDAAALEGVVGEVEAAKEDGATEAAAPEAVVKKLLWRSVL